MPDGAYVLRLSVTDWSDEKLWKAYIQLTQAEAAFRINKDQLRVRPIWHQRTDRVQAHILVCFLAFVLWKTLEMWQQRAGLGNSPRTLLEEFARIQSHDGILPMQAQVEVRLLWKRLHGGTCFRTLEFIFDEGVTKRRQSALLLHEVLAISDDWPTTHQRRYGMSHAFERNHNVLIVLAQRDLCSG